jgi:hypothetical protein
MDADGTRGLMAVVSSLVSIVVDGREVMALALPLSNRVTILRPGVKCGVLPGVRFTPVASLQLGCQMTDPAVSPPIHSLMLTLKWLLIPTRILSRMASTIGIASTV